MRNFKLLAFSVLLAGLIPASSHAQAQPVALERATGTRLAEATGHFGRTRSLLIAAVREFDKATAKVDPKALIDEAEYRSILLDRIEDLDRILSPQPRATKSGIRYDSDTRLLGNLGEAPKRK